MNTRERILNAAVCVFAVKGRYGAHMEEIASKAHINKAMIYYLFRSKDMLYLEVLKFVFSKAGESLAPFADRFISEGKSYTEVLSDYITSQFDFFYKNSNYTKILIDAMSNGAEEIPVAVKHIRETYENTVYHNNQIKNFFEEGKKQKIFRNIDTEQLIISMMGMIMIYFFSNSITESLDIEVKDEESFLESRRRSIIDIVLNGIMEK